MANATNLVPSPNKIRELIQTHFAEIRLLRSLLRVAEKAEHLRAPHAKLSRLTKGVQSCKGTS